MDCENKPFSFTQLSAAAMLSGAFRTCDHGLGHFDGKTSQEELTEGFWRLRSRNRDSVTFCHILSQSP